MRRFRKKEDGSMTLEAAMVVPLFLLFIVFLATIIRIAIAEVAMEHAASETAEIVATHVYPVKLAADKSKSVIDSYIEDGTNGQLDFDKSKELLQDALKELGVTVSVGNLINQLAGTVLNPFIQKKFAEAIKEDGGGSAFFKKSNLTSQVEFKDDGAGKAIRIEVKYNMNSFVPFFDKKIILKRQAYEKLWGY